MADASFSGDESVELVVPLRARFSLMLRLLSASLGVEAGLSGVEIDDFRLALSEVFALLVPGHEGQRASVRFSMLDGGLTAELSSPAGGELAMEPDELALTILRSVVDEYSLGPHRIRLVKRAAELRTA